MKQRGRKRLKTGASRIEESLNTELSLSEKTENDINVTSKRSESVASSLSVKDTFDINRQQKDDIGDANQLLETLPITSTDSSNQEKLSSSLPPSRTSSLSNNSSNCSNSKRKAVAIVRPQPQQLQIDPLVGNRKISHESSPGDIRTKLDNEIIDSELNERLISRSDSKIGKELKKSKFERSKIKALSAKTELRQLQNEREARYSLYDFPSDSEPETDSNSSLVSSLGDVNGKTNNGNTSGLEIEEKSTNSNVINKNITNKSLSSLKSKHNELKAAGNNNSSLDRLLLEQHRKLEKTSSSPPPHLATSRSTSKSATDATDVISDQPVQKVISTLPSSLNCNTLSRLPITTIAPSFPNFDTKTTSSASDNGNNNRSLGPPYSDLIGSHSVGKPEPISSTENVSGSASSLSVSQNKDAIGRRKLQKINQFPSKIPSTVSSSSFASSSESISSAEPLRMQAETNTIAASSNYHHSQHTHQSHQHGEHQQSHHSSYANLRDDRSDSGLSTLRSDGARSSGDERSGSRSSAVSDEILLRVAGGVSGGPLQTSHTGRPNSAHAPEHTRPPNHTPPASLNPPFGNTTSSSRPLHPSSSAASPTWKDLSTYKKLLPGQPPVNINKASKLQTLPPMSSEARPPPPSAVSRGGTSGALGHTSHHLPSAVAPTGAPPSTVSLSTTSQQHAAVAAAMSAAHQQQWASVAAAHQYQAALQAASLVASQNPSQAAQQALLAQYQSLAAASAGISPDVLKQYPHLATGIPHHLLQGRGSAGAGASTTAHHDMLIAREREPAERDRVIR